MSCDARDQNLLLLIHGELPLLQQSLTKMHLRRCPRCRERQEQLCAVSHLLAGALRERDPAPVPMAATRLSVQSPSLWLRRPLLVSLVLLMAVLSLMAFVGAVGSRLAGGGAMPGIQQPNKAPGDGCRPDLPNDRCR